MISKKEEMVYEKRIRRMVTDIKETKVTEFRRLFFLQGQASFIQQHMNYNSNNPRLVDMANMACDQIALKTDKLVDLDIEKDLDESSIEVIENLNNLEVEDLKKIILDLNIKTESKDKKYLIKLIKKEYNENC